MTIFTSHVNIFSHHGKRVECPICQFFMGTHPPEDIRCFFDRIFRLSIVDLEGNHSPQTFFTRSIFHEPSIIFNCEIWRCHSLCVLFINEMRPVNRIIAFLSNKCYLFVNQFISIWHTLISESSNICDDN